MTAAAACLVLGALAATGAAIAGCASFADAPPNFSAAPSLTPNVATVVPPTSPAAAAFPSPSSPTSTPATNPGGSTASKPGATASTPQTGATTRSQSSPTPPSNAPGGPDAADACAPPQPPVVAVCLTAPWGLAPLPDGQSALVGERVSGRVLRVAAEHQPQLVATVGDVDATHGGGLLGIALSPDYVEDGLVYAYVTTATDSRIVRIAPGGAAKVIVTGLPAGGAHPGGAIAFGADGLLYVATGSAGGSDAGGADALAVLRFDAFGKPAASKTSHTAVVATGLTDPTGMCPLPDGRIGVVDHRGAGDALIIVTDGANYRSLTDGQTLWTYAPGDGGAADCAVSAGALLASQRTATAVTRIEMRAAGGFTGMPDSLLDGQYGRLRTVVTGPDDLVWLTTANKQGGGRAGAAASEYDGQAPGPGPGSDGRPDPGDDRVIVLPAGGGGGSAGGVD